MSSTREPRGLGARHPARSGGRPGRARGLAGVLAIALAAAVSSACMPLPPEGGLGLTAGPLSDQWNVTWDPEFRTPARMTNRSIQDEVASGAAVSDATAEAAFRTVLAEYPDWFRLRPGEDDFRNVRSYAREWLRVVRMAQTYRGIPVAGAGYEISVLPSGRLGTIEGRFHPEIRIDVVPILNPEQAESRARVALDSTPSGNPPYPTFRYEYENGFYDPAILVILSRERGYTLAWAVLVRRPPNATWRVYTDANTGDVIGVQNLGESWMR